MLILVENFIGSSWARDFILCFFVPRIGLIALLKVEFEYLQFAMQLTKNKKSVQKLDTVIDKSTQRVLQDSIFKTWIKSNLNEDAHRVCWTRWKNCK